MINRWKLVDVQESEFAKPEWVESLGSYNVMPTPYTEITQDDWVAYIRTWGLVGEFYDSRQVLDLPDTHGFARVQISWYHDRGMAIVHPNKEADLKFYRIGCYHKHRELSQAECRERGIYHAGNCYHVSECATCGHVEAVDSSG